MTAFWWVNHKQTARQELAGGYLWSPKQEAGGARSQFYENMRAAAPGDLVLSLADGRIANVGQVRELALSAPKPNEFGDVGSYWANEGWFLPIRWRSLPKPVRPKQVIATLRPLLPEKYSPIQAKNGNGNQKAYLASISQGLFAAVLSEAGAQSARLFEDVPPLLATGEAAERFDDVVASHLSDDPNLERTEKEQLLKARRGQGVFRDNVISIEGKCRLTGIATLSLLRASHIKPWRACLTSKERLDGNNGLLLTPNADLLFDHGLITFGDDGELVVSAKLAGDDLARLGLGDSVGKKGRAFNAAQRIYLRYHRESVFVR